MGLSYSCWSRAISHHCRESESARKQPRQTDVCNFASRDRKLGSRDQERREVSVVHSESGCENG